MGSYFYFDISRYFHLFDVSIYKRKYIYILLLFISLAIPMAPSCSREISTKSISSKSNRNGATHRYMFFIDNTGSIELIKHNNTCGTSLYKAPIGTPLSTGVFNALIKSIAQESPKTDEREKEEYVTRDLYLNQDNKVLNQDNKVHWLTLGWLSEYAKCNIYLDQNKCGYNYSGIANAMKMVRQKSIVYCDCSSLLPISWFTLSLKELRRKNVDAVFIKFPRIPSRDGGPWGHYELVDEFPEKRNYIGEYSIAEIVFSVSNKAEFRHLEYYLMRCHYLGIIHIYVEIEPNIKLKIYASDMGK